MELINDWEFFTCVTAARNQISPDNFSRGRESIQFLFLKKKEKLIQSQAHWGILLYN